MIHSIVSVLQNLSFTHALLLALFFVLVFWAVLWSYEVYFLRKRVDKLDILRGFFSEAFDELDIPMAYFEDDGHPYVNGNFFGILNLKPTEDIKEALVARLKPQLLIDSWDGLVRYLEFQSQEFIHILESEGQNYCLHARALNSIVYMWMTLFKTPENDYIYAKRMIDNIPIALWYRNNQGNIVYCNQIYAGALGTTVDKIINEKHELYPPQRNRSPYKLSLKAVENNTLQVERIHSVIFGSRRYLEIGTMPLRNRDSLGYAFDITEIENLQKQLQKQIKSNSELLEHMSTSIAIYGSDTRLAFFNRAYVNLFQFDENWLLTKPTLGDILEDLRTRRKIPEYPNFQAHKKSRMQFFKTLLEPFQELLHQPNGQTLRMFVAPHCLGGIFYIFEDMSDKIMLERQYNTLIAVQKETIDNLFDAILVFGSDCRLQIMNQSFRRMFNIYERDWFLGRTLQEVIEVDNPLFSFNKKELLNLLMVIFTQRSPIHDEIALTDERIIRYAYLPLPDGSHLISLVDITDSVHFQETLKKRNRILEEVDALKSYFIKHISYELKIPLNVIQNHVMDMQASQNSTHKEVTITKETVDSIRNLLSIVNDTLDLTHIESEQLTLKPEDISLTKFLKYIVSLVARRAKEQGIHIKVENKVPYPTFKGDEKRLKQAFFNILTNTVKYKMTKGPLILCTQEKVIEKRDYLCFSITGSGFNMEKFDTHQSLQTSPMDKEEDAFLVSNHPFMNELLGLTLVKRIIDLHGGWLQLEKLEASQNESMLTFNIYIPRYPISTDIECVPPLKKD